MPAITESLRVHHGVCDELFALAENAAVTQDWELCRSLTDSFLQQLEAHFSAEETLLFPRFEAVLGNTSGPTAVMRAEHGQMRELAGDISQAAVRSDGDAYLGCIETMLVLMQQHNMKEEHILYPMCERALAGPYPELGDLIGRTLTEAPHGN